MTGLDIVVYFLSGVALGKWQKAVKGDGQKNKKLYILQRLGKQAYSKINRVYFLS